MLNNEGKSMKNLKNLLKNLQEFLTLKNDFINSKDKILEYKNVIIKKHYNKFTIFIKNINIYDKINNIAVPNNLKWVTLNKYEFMGFMHDNDNIMPFIYDLLRFKTIINTDTVKDNKYLLIFPLYYGNGNINHLQVSASYEYDTCMRIFNKLYGYDLKTDNNNDLQHVSNFIFN